jgi:hypothetical protein
MKPEDVKIPYGFRKVSVIVVMDIAIEWQLKAHDLRLKKWAADLDKAVAAIHAEINAEQQPRMPTADEFMGELVKQNIPPLTMYKAVVAWVQDKSKALKYIKWKGN